MKLAPIFQGIANWLSPRLGLKSRAELQAELAAVTAERSYWSEQIAHYAAAHTRLTPFTDNLTGETAAHRLAYRTLLKEPMAKIGLMTKINAVAQLDLTMTAGEKSPIGQNIAEYNKDNLTKSKGGIRGIVEAMLWGALLDGFSVSEKVRAVGERGKWKGKIVLEELVPKDTSSNRIQLNVNEYKKIVSIKANSPNGDVEYDPSEFVVFTYLGLFRNPLGMSDMRAVIRACECKLSAIQLRMIFLDKFTGPYLVGKHNNEGTRVYMESALAKARAAGYITIPEGSELQVLSLAMSGTADFKSAIDDFDREILIGLTGASLQILEGQTPDGRGDTSVQRSTAQLLVWHLAQLVADAINDQIIPDFTDKNFPGMPALPVAALGGVDPASVVAELAIGGMLHTNGVSTSLEEWYEKAQWSPPKSPEDALAGVVAAGGFGLGAGFGGGLGDPFAPDAAPVDPAAPAPADTQASAVATNDLKATVGGSAQIAALQTKYYSGELPREAAVANATILFGFSAAEAEALFPIELPVKLTPPEEKPIDPNAPPVVQPVPPPVPFDDAAPIVAGGSRPARPFRLTWAKAKRD